MVSTDILEFVKGRKKERDKRREEGERENRGSGEGRAWELRSIGVLRPHYHQKFGRTSEPSLVVLPFVK